MFRFGVRLVVRCVNLLVLMFCLSVCGFSVVR